MNANMWAELRELPYREQLLKTALRLTRNREDAEDLVQETFLKAFRHWQGFQPGTNLKAWLFKILKNTFINHYRRQKAVPPQADFADLEENFEAQILVEPEKSPEDELLDRSWDQEVLAAVKKLPHNYKVVVLLSDIEGYSYKEIAEILAIPLGTVMSRLYRGRRALEKTLLAFGKSHNYLRHAPRRLRSAELAVEKASPESGGERLQ